MAAYFSSKSFSHAKTALAVVLLWACVIGIQQFGFTHSISHASQQQTAIGQNISSDASASLNHSSDVCHLLDALTLAEFIPTTNVIAPALLIASTVPISITPTPLPRMRYRHTSLEHRLPSFFKKRF
ncbi:hypothetical protein [Polynucleobacter necessarius]|uniref:hypothetical protein n=1 Tax=Polynucleobacter necessarius TaxID=576610 RepID=UPI000E094F0B|nr:hypothetical protein [Polynucleobacter necessarius]